jgi:hypothetical protein
MLWLSPANPCAFRNNAFARLCNILCDWRPVCVRWKAVLAPPRSQPSGEAALPRSAAAMLNAIAAAGTLLAAHIALIYLYRIDSDEPQHLHVAWEWSRGMVPYRDFFDNHMPLFHFLTSPLPGYVQDGSLLYVGRWAMLPLVAGLFAVLSRVVRLSYGESNSWIAATALLIPAVALKTTEFRNDTLAMLLTLAAFTAALQWKHSLRGAAISGALFGAAFLTSFKALLFLAAFLLADLAVRREQKEGISWKRYTVLAAAFATVMLPFVIWFAWRGAIPAWVECAFIYNSRFPVPAIRRIAGALLAAPLLFGSIRLMKRIGRPDPEAYQLRLTVAFFTVILLCGWPLITTRDWLPVLPLATIVLFCDVLTSTGMARYALIAFMIVAEAIAIVDGGGLLEGRRTGEREYLADVAQVTVAADPVADLKGESIFRRRPTYYILERVSLELYRSGKLRDTIWLDIIRNRCHVAAPDSNSFPPETRAFLNRYFLPYGSLRIAASPVDGGGYFSIAVPGTYVVLGEEGRVAARVDRRQTDAAGFALQPGVHRIEWPERPLVVIWSPAVDRGFIGADRLRKPAGAHMLTASR